MCLNLTSLKEFVATKDIVCYKRLRYNLLLNESVYATSGKTFTAKIKDIPAEGIINVEEDEDNDKRVFLCTDNPEFDGLECKNKHGKLYSWVHDKRVTDLIIEDTPDIYTYEYYTAYREFKVEIGNTYTSELIREENEVSIGLHSFAKLKDCKNDGSGVYIRCIIPKGAKYYRGTFFGANCYASDTLIYKKIVK